MNALVLGGTQFIGRTLAMELVARGHAVSILTRGRLPVDYEGLHARYVADRRNAESLRQLEGKRFDAVFDVSGYGAADVRPVLEALRPGTETRYVFLSSGAVYKPSSAPLSEDAPKGENEQWGRYGTDKLAAEELLREHRSREGFALSVVRPAYVYGPGNNLYREAYLFDRLERGEVVPVPQGGTTTQFVHIDDLVNLLIDISQRALDGEIEAFNCAHPEPVGWPALVEAAAEAMDVEPRFKGVDYRGVMDPREFFPFRDCTYLLDVGRAARFGLVPAIDLREGLAETYAWYRRVRPRLIDPKMNRVEEALAAG